MTEAPGAGARFQTRNPADLSEVVWEVELATAGRSSRRADGRRAAQRSWADVPAPVRGRVIAQVGRLVETNKEALAALVTREVGKPYAESLGEVQEVIDTCDFFLGEGRRLYGQTVPSEMADKQLFTFRVPVGVAAIITAANFPTAVPSWYLVPALLCGNAVVWKPAETSAAVAQALLELFRNGGVPEGVLGLVLADGPTTFAGLEQALEEGLVDKVGFTGSTAVGRAIGELAGRHLQSACLELGGKNPLVVMPDADLDLAVQGALFSGFGTSGQRCTSLGTAWAHRDVYDDFRGSRSSRRSRAPSSETRTRRCSTARCCPSATSTTTCATSTSSPSTTRCTARRGIGRITSGQPAQGLRRRPRQGRVRPPDVVEGIRPGDALYDTETFGPLVGLGVFDSFDEAVELASGHGYGLSAAIYTGNAKQAFDFRARVGAGMVSVNNSTSGRRGAPAVRRQRPLGQRLAAVRDLGARPVHPLAVDELGRQRRLQKAQMDTLELPYDPGFRLA